MERHIAIIGAMDEEVEALSQSLTSAALDSSPFQDLPVFTGYLADQKAVVVRCGIGKVHAALAAQYIIDRYNPSFLINSGVAGGLSPQVRIGDLVLGTSSIQHDFDVRNFGYAKGVIPRLATSTFTADPHLLELAHRAAKEVLAPEKIHRGLIVSGDQFVSSLEQRQEITAHFPEALCVEMEGAAIAQVASVNSVPHLILRAISDQADNTAPRDFDEYLLEVIPLLNKVIHRLAVLLKD